MPPDGADKSARFAFVVSRQVAASASDRNRLKRRARAIIRELLPKIRNGRAYFLFFKKGAAQLSYLQLGRALRDIFIRSSSLAN